MTLACKGDGQGEYYNLEEFGAKQIIAEEDQCPEK